MTEKDSAVKKTGRRAAGKAALLVVTLLLVTAIAATALVACKPDAPPAPTEAELRAQAVSSFVDNAVAAAGEGWKTDMSAAEAAALDSPSAYIVASAWIERAGALMSGMSTLSTGKIKALSDYMTTDDAKSLLRSSFDFEKLVKAFSDSGLTSADTQEIIFALLRELADGEEIFTAIGDSLDAAAACASGTRLADIENTRTAVSALLSAYSGNDGIADSIQAAKTGICALVDMAYQGMYMFGSGETGDGLYAIIDAMNAGALSDISKADAYTYLKSFLSQAAALRDKFTADEVALLSDTLGKLDDAFGGLALPSSLGIGGMLGYFGEMKFAVDWMYYSLDTVYNAGNALLNERDGQGALTYRFIDRLFDYAAANGELEDETAKEYNSAILYAELVLAAEEEGAFGDKLAAQLARYASETDMDNLINLFACSALLDIWVYEGQATAIEDMIEPEQYRAISIVVAGIYVNSFKNAYAQGLVSGNHTKTKTRYNQLRERAKSLCEEFGLEVPSWVNAEAPASVTSDWYKTVVASAESLVNAAADRIAADETVDYRQDAVEHITAAVERFLARDSVRAALESLAAADFATADMTAEELSAWTKTMEGYKDAFMPLWNYKGNASAAQNA